MPRLFAVAALLLLAGCSAPPPTTATGTVAMQDAPATAPMRILVFTRTLGWRHDSIPTAVEALREIAADAGLETVHSEDPALFDERSLSGFRVVVFANTTGEVLDDDQRAAFERYVHGGGGFLGVHSAADTGHDWPWYGRLVGAWFQSHPPGLQRSDVRFEQGRHPPGTPTWRVTDELYNYTRNPRADVDVIATVDERQYAGGTMGTDHPIAWCHARLGGRAWYTGLGHDGAIYADPVFRAHLLRGLRYAAGQSDDC